jgi:uncharacterized phage-like protein YoqJ
MNENDVRCITLKQKLYDLAEAAYFSGVRHFICGMAMGCDLYFCEEVIRLRNEHMDITLEAALPCEGQTNNWPEYMRNRYFGLVYQCDVETLVSREYSHDCMLKRNRYMVDHSSVLIAVFDGVLGGTMQTINYARKKGLEIIQIRPCG